MHITKETTFAKKACESDSHDCAATGALFPVLAIAQSDANIDYQIMIQRATQTAIWAMPAVVPVEFKKATVRDFGGTIIK